MSEQEIKQTYLSPRWTGEIADCSFPVTFDTYSRCSFGCLYCFSAFQKTLHRGRSEANFYEKPVTCVNAERVKKVFTGEAKSQFWPWIEQKRPIQWGGGWQTNLIYTKKSTEKRWNCWNSLTL